MRTECTVEFAKLEAILGSNPSSNARKTLNEMEALHTKNRSDRISSHQLLLLTTMMEQSLVEREKLVKNAIKAAVDDLEIRR